MLDKEKFERQFGIIRGIKDDFTRDYLLSLASRCFHKTLDENTINTGAVIVLLAERIMKIELVKAGGIDET